VKKAAANFLIVCGTLVLLAGLNETYSAIFETGQGHIQNLVSCYLVGAITLNLGLKYRKTTSN